MAYGVCPAPCLSSSNDSLALVTLYNSTDGINWNNTWDLAQPISTWYGVTSTGGCVIEVDLSSNGLIGSIPPEIEDLNNLTRLNLSSNDLNGNIPPEIGNLNNLVRLGLSSNDLSGSIPPEIGNLNNLDQLSFSSNQLHRKLEI